MTYEAEIEQLFDALTDYTCKSHYDIAHTVGWTEAKVAQVLATIRRPEVADEWGWTVPHVPRGPGEHLYQVVATDGSPLDADEAAAVRAGALSTLRYIASSGENEATALRMAADLAGTSTGKRLRRLATVHQAAGDMARDLVDSLNGA